MVVASLSWIERFDNEYRILNASSREDPQNSGSALKSEHTFGREGSPYNAHL